MPRVWGRVLARDKTCLRIFSQHLFGEICYLGDTVNIGSFSDLAPRVRAFADDVLGIGKAFNQCNLTHGKAFSDFTNMAHYYYKQTSTLDASPLSRHQGLC